MKTSPVVDEQAIIKQLFKEKDTYQASNLTQRDEINAIYNVYIGKMDAVKNVPYKSKESNSKLRTEISYIVPSIYSGEPVIEIQGVGEEDEMLAQIFEKIVNYRLQTIPQAYEKIESWVKQSVTFGTSLLKVIWRFETEDVNEDGEDGQPAQSYQTPTKDEPDFEVPNILDCFYNPIIPEVPGQSSMIFRSVLSVDEVKDNSLYDFAAADGTLNRDKVESKGKIASNPYDSSNQAKSDLIDMQKASQGTVEVYERITEDRIQTVVDGKERLVLRDKPWQYGFINAVKFAYEPNCVPNRFEGWGVGQNTLGIGKRLYRLDNQMEDGIKLTNNPMFMFLKGNGIDPRQLVAKPGGGVSVDDKQGRRITDVIQPIQFPDQKQGAIDLKSMLDDDHKRASGATDIFTGQAFSRNQGLQQATYGVASHRFELINRRFKNCLGQVAEMLIQMELENIQSIDAPILRIFPSQIEMQNGSLQPSREIVYQLLISPEAKDCMYNIKVRGETNVAVNKDVQIQQLTDWVNLFAKVLPPQNLMEAAKKILELRGIDDIGKLVPDPQQFSQQQAPQGQPAPMQPDMNQMGPISPQMMQHAPTQQGINQSVMR